MSKKSKETLVERSEREGQAKLKDMQKKKKVPEEEHPVNPDGSPGKNVKVSEEKGGEEEMAKFLFKTLQTPLTSYRGPSGVRYQIQQNIPFVVRNKEDIEFFKNNHRFEKVNILTKKPDPIQKNQDQLLKEELEKVEGLTEKTIEKVVELYVSKEHLTDVVEQNYELDPSISKEQAEIIKKYIKKGDQ